MVFIISMNKSKYTQFEINEAIYNNDYAELINMLDDGVSPYILTASDGTTALMASVVGFQDVLLNKILQKKHGDFVFADFKILCSAIQNNNINAFNSLIKEKFFLENINYNRNLDGNTVLHLSCFYGFDEITGKLLDVGASIDVSNIYNKKAVEYFVISSNSVDILEKFIKAGVDLNKENEFGFSCLDIIRSKLLQLSNREEGKEIMRVLIKNDVFIF